jgi:hypothetical protein
MDVRLPRGITCGCRSSDGPLAGNRACSDVNQHAVPLGSYQHLLRQYATARAELTEGIALSGEKDAIFWKVRPEGGLEIKPGETVTLKPGSDHLSPNGITVAVQLPNVDVDVLIGGQDVRVIKGRLIA